MSRHEDAMSGQDQAEFLKTMGELTDFALLTAAYEYEVAADGFLGESNTNPIAADHLRYLAELCREVIRRRSGEAARHIPRPAWWDRASEQMKPPSIEKYVQGPKRRIPFEFKPRRIVIDHFRGAVDSGHVGSWPVELNKTRAWLMTKECKAETSVESWLAELNALGQES